MPFEKTGKPVECFYFTLNYQGVCKKNSKYNE